MLFRSGFETVPFYSRYDDIEAVLGEIRRIGEIRGTLPFDIDGAVVKVDRFAERVKTPLLPWGRPEALYIL